MIKKTIFTIGLLYFLLGGKAQITDSTSRYPFINYSADTLIFNSDSSQLKHFFSKYENVIQTGEGKINILHIGGSHVQAGTFPHTIRQQLLTLHPDRIGSRGVIFPYSAAPRSNNPQDYQVRSIGSFQIIRNVFAEHAVPLGVTGVAVTTADTCAEIRIILKDSTLQFKTNRIVLLGYSDSSYIRPTIWIDSTEYYPISFDSVKKRFLFETKSFIDSFTLRMNNTNGEGFVINGFYLGNEENGVTYHSIGVNGAHVPSYLNCTNFERDLDLINPDLVIFGIGINDASGPNFNPEEFKQNYLALIQIIKKQNPNCAFIFVTNNDSYKKVRVKIKKKWRWRWENNKNGVLVQNCMFELANITNGAVFDQFEIMGGEKSMVKWVEAGLAQKDRVHFTKAGYTLMGTLFFEALIDASKKLKQIESNHLE